MLLKFRYEHLRKFCDQCGMITHDSGECLPVVGDQMENDNGGGDPHIGDDAEEEAGNPDPVDMEVPMQGFFRISIM